MLTEADTCRKYVVPRLLESGWDTDPHSFIEQFTFTDGRIVGAETNARRLDGKRTDYILRYTRDFPIAVVEAKRRYKTPATGMQQAKDYAEILGLKFAYATNGEGIVEYDYTTGVESELASFPSPSELWSRFEGSEGLSPPATNKLLTPMDHKLGKGERYYQRIAINETVLSIIKGKRRILLTMATGTGKTAVALQICHKLWTAGWNARGESRRPRILYLADRNVLVDQPKDTMFAGFGDARWKLENGQAVKSREMYFATYQAIARDERRPGLYREFDPEFFDLVIVDECHRGSAKEESNWREILEYFDPAFQLGMTATPKRSDNIDTYSYFGNPIYTYSLRQGIDDGFLAPYRVHRVITSLDAAGWRPTKGELDLYGREVPDREYGTPDFERRIALRTRTAAIAKHLSDFLIASNRFAKTIIFCVNQEHADEMRRALGNLNSDLMKDYPDYVARITADEGHIGRGLLDKFMDVEARTPTIVTTSQLLTTGVDVPTCTNIVLVRVINSIVEFKQIIGRGTRVRDDYGKLTFNILDYTGATRLFADPEFDGDPALLTEVEINDIGETIPGSEKTLLVEVPSEPDEANDLVQQLDDQDLEPRRRYYVDGGQVEIAAQFVYELDSDGRQLRIVKYTDYAAEKVRTLFTNAADLRQQWKAPVTRSEVVEALAGRGISLVDLVKFSSQPEADPFDLVCNLAFNTPIRTRRERVDRLRKDEREFFDKYAPDARLVLEQLLEKYAIHGMTQFTVPDILKVPPISERGNVAEISALFGGAENLRVAIDDLQSLLYAA